MFQILESCQENLNNCCSDYALAKYLDVVKQVLNIIHIIVPIILIIMGTVEFIKMITNPDNKKSYKSLLNKVIATVIIFFLPFIVNLVIGLFDGSKYDVVKCWEQSSEIVEKMK